MNTKSQTAPSECAILLMSHGRTHSDTDKAIFGVRLLRERRCARSGAKTPSLLLQVMDKVFGAAKLRRRHNAMTIPVPARG